MVEAKRLEAWARYLSEIRSFFDEKGFLEISSPTLVPAGAFEASLDCLKVEGMAGRWELPTSPEIEMKRTLAAAGRSIYEIARAWRDDPPSPVHGREFHMLEFYRVGADCDAVIGDTLDLMRRLSSVPLSFSRASVAELFARHVGFDLVPGMSREDLISAVRAKGVACREEDSWEDVFFRTFVERIETRLDPSVPVVVTGYPIEVSPLSKGNPKTGLAERFEIYWRGMELCNGCSELGDLAELRRRYQKETESRAREGKRAHPVPERLYQALERGLPECAGVAVGLERLFRCVGPADYFPSSGELF